MKSRLGGAMVAGLLIGSLGTLNNPSPQPQIVGELHKEPGHKKRRLKRKQERINKRNGRNFRK